jgi:hypothetical protein
MPEYFELTFFCNNNSKKEVSINTVMRLFNITEQNTVGTIKQYPLLYGKEFIFDIFESLDFYEIRISVPDLIFTKKNLSVKVEQLCSMVDSVMKNVAEVVFATGIFELTSYYLITIHKVQCLADITEGVLARFPFVFFRDGYECSFLSTQRYGSISYSVRSGANVQDVFTNPIRELMEDRGMSFKEADKRVQFGL